MNKTRLKERINELNINFYSYKVTLVLILLFCSYIVLIPILIFIFDSIININKDYVNFVFILAHVSYAVLGLLLIFHLVKIFNNLIYSKKGDHLKIRTLILTSFVIILIAINVSIVALIWETSDDIFFSSYFESKNNVTSSSQRIDYFSYLSIPGNLQKSFVFILMLVLIMSCLLTLIIFLVHTFYSTYIDFNYFINEKAIAKKVIEENKKFIGNKLQYLFLGVFIGIVVMILSETNSTLDKYSQISQGIATFLIITFSIPIYSYFLYNSIKSMYQKIEKRWGKLDTNNKNDIQIKKSTLEKNLFNELQIQIKASDSFLWSYLLIYICLAAIWIFSASYNFELDIRISVSYLVLFQLLLLLIPYIDANKYIKQNAISYVIENRLYECIDTINEVMGFRHTIIAIIIPLAGGLIFIFSNFIT